MKKSNEKLQKDVQEAIKWEPLLHAAEIGVIIHNGIVTLTGTVDSYAKKRQAEDAAKNVIGVLALVDDLEVKLDSSSIKNDTDVATEVVKALRDTWSVPDNKIKVTVDEGWVTLEGTLHWNYQREAAKNAVRYLSGVRGVINKMKIEAEIKDELEQEKVKQALRRNWAIDADKIHVKAHDKTIILSGIVSSLFQKEEAEKIAWNTPGVWFVDNQLIVEHDFVNI
ncbi:Osmotically-inducible protein Y precursor [compost metagenome]